MKSETWKVWRENVFRKIAAFKNIITSEARFFFENNETFTENWKLKNVTESIAESIAESIVESIAQKSI